MVDEEPYSSYRMGLERKEAQSGTFAARVVILPLEAKLFMFFTGRSSLPVFMYSKVQRSVFVCVCAQNGRTGKQKLH